MTTLLELREENEAEEAWKRVNEARTVLSLNLKHVLSCSSVCYAACAAHCTRGKQKDIRRILGNW
jgi:hypothetical protein